MDLWLSSIQISYYSTSYCLDFELLEKVEKFFNMLHSPQNYKCAFFYLCYYIKYYANNLPSNQKM